MTKKLWVVEYIGRDVPQPRFFVDWEDIGVEVIAADQFFTLVYGEYDVIDRAVSEKPYQRLAGHPADGVCVSEGGDKVYVLNAHVVDTFAELADGLGLKPQDYGGETWDGVDEDIVPVPRF